MSNFNDANAKKEFDHTMLKTLLVEFLRDINIPLSTVNNTRLRALFRFICPTVVIPTHQELRCWDKVPNSAILNDERLKMVRKWARAGPKKRDVCVSRDEQSLGESPQIDPDIASSSLSGFRPSDAEHWGLSSGDKDIKEELLDDEYEDSKPTPEELKMPLAEPHSSSTSCGGKIRTRNFTRTPLLNKLEQIPGFSKYPCIVCNQQRESKTLRMVTNVNAFIMIHLCVKSGQYTMELGKQLARMERFGCCVGHLSDIYDHAKQYLSVSDPEHDIHPGNEKIVEVYYSVKELRDSRYIRRSKIGGGQQLNYKFINEVKQFFVTYGRQNYKPGPGMVGYLVEKD